MLLFGVLLAVAGATDPTQTVTGLGMKRVQAAVLDHEADSVAKLVGYGERARTGIVQAWARKQLAAIAARGKKNPELLGPESSLTQEKSALEKQLAELPALDAECARPDAPLARKIYRGALVHYHQVLADYADAELRSVRKDCGLNSRAPACQERLNRLTCLTISASALVEAASPGANDSIIRRAREWPACPEAGR